MKYLTLLFVLFVFKGFSQELRIQFVVNDEMTETILDSVLIQVTETSGKQLFKGRVGANDEIAFQAPANNIIRVNAFKKGYHPLENIVNLSAYDREIRKERVIQIDLNLKYDGQITVEYDVTALYKPEIAFASERISVSDFVVLDENTMVILAYSKKLSTASELLWYANDSIVSTKKVPGKAIRLETDYRNRIFLRCEYKDYLLKNDEALDLVQVPRKQLDNFIKPILDTVLDEQLYFTTYKSHYPAFDFYKVQMKDSSHNLLHHIEDTEMMEQYRAEYKWADVRTKLWAWDMEDQTGVDREVWVGANVFTNSIYYEAPYSEFFIIDNEVLVFDFYRDQLFKYDANTGEAIDSTAISFHKDARKTGWERKMIKDPITQKIYTFYDDGGYLDLYEINQETGQRKEKFTLFYRYVEEIQIQNDQVFYVYRPFESLQKKYLYVEGFNDVNRSLEGQNRFERN